MKATRTSYLDRVDPKGKRRPDGDLEKPRPEKRRPAPPADDDPAVASTDLRPPETDGPQPPPEGVSDAAPAANAAPRQSPKPKRRDPRHTEPEAELRLSKLNPWNLPSVHVEYSRYTGLK